jgi:hypothetical protein
VRIPQSRLSRRDMDYARLLVRIYPRRTMANAFDGVLLKPGSLIDEAALWPTPEYPETPILLEYAGNDHTGRGHRRSNDIYLLWRYERDRKCWVELVRTTSQGAEWIEHLKPIAILELRRDSLPDAFSAAGVSAAVLAALDRQLELLDPLERHLAMAFVYQEFTARALAYAA